MLSLYCSAAVLKSIKIGPCIQTIEIKHTISFLGITKKVLLAKDIKDNDANYKSGLL